VILEIAKRMATEAAFKTGRDHMVWRMPKWPPGGYGVRPTEDIMGMPKEVEAVFVAKAPETGRLF
jgi:hypothetical protein